MNILIIGAGDIGYHLAQRLTHDNHDIRLIDTDPAKVKRVSETIDAHAILGSGTSYITLQEADAESADILAAVSNNDEVNLLACRIAKKLGIETTIARVRNPEYKSDSYCMTPEELGCDFIIQPEKQTAKSIVRLIRQSNATDLVEFEKGKIQITGLRLDDHAEVLDIPFMDLGRKLGNPPLRILAIKRKQFTIIPRGQDMLMAGDQVYLVCSPDFMPQAMQLFGKSQKRTSDIMIIGGGLVGEFIARELEGEMNIKIIESDKKKAAQLADKLHDAMVLYGDGSDLDLLTFEGMPDMDDFIAVTGNDETNLITSLIAKHLKVPRTVTLVRKMEYLPMTQALGIDTFVSKQYITVNTIQKFIRGRQVAFFAELPGIEAEIIEFIASEGSKIVRKPLMSINFPKGAIVGAVLKQDEMIIPQGLTQIDAGDKVIVFCKPEAVRNVEKIFK